MDAGEHHAPAPPPRRAGSVEGEGEEGVREEAVVEEAVKRPRSKRLGLVSCCVLEPEGTTCCPGLLSG